MNYDKEDAIERLWQARIDRARRRDDKVNRVASLFAGRWIRPCRTAVEVIKRYDYARCGGLTPPLWY